MKTHLEILPQKSFQENDLVIWSPWWCLVVWHIQMLELVQKGYHCVFKSRTSRLNGPPSFAKKAPFTKLFNFCKWSFYVQWSIKPAVDRTCGVEAMFVASWMTDVFTFLLYSFEFPTKCTCIPNGTFTHFKRCQTSGRKLW